jgi:hypothetical protein
LQAKSTKESVSEIIKKSEENWKKNFKSSKITNLKKLSKKRFTEDSQSSQKNSYRFDQKQYLSEFKDKVQESKEFVKKLARDQKERKQRLEYREEIRENLFAEEDEEEQRLKQEEIQEIARKKHQQLLSLQEKSKERKNNLKFMKELAERDPRKAYSQAPLYKRLEENFIANFEMPELEKRKEELRKKHELFKPFNYEQLKEHAREFDKALSDHSRSRIYASQSKPYKKSKFLIKIIEENQSQAEESKQKHQIKKEMFEKKKKYSEIVKDVYTPSIDSLKQKEMILIKAKLENPSPFKQYFDNSFARLEKTYSQNSKKFKENPMVPKKASKKEIVIKDYIQEFRLARKRSLSSSYLNPITEDDLVSVSSPQQRKTLQKKLEKIEKEVRKSEIKIGLLSPLNSKSLEVSDQVNSLIVDSIKAKIAILDSKV